MSDFLSDLGKGVASTAANGVVDTALSLFGQGIVNKQARENYKWQYDNFFSPKAQVKAMTAAGLNPAAVFGNNAPVLNSGGLSIPANPLGGIGTSSLSDISNYIMAKSQAKKTGAEVKNLDIEAEAKQFELELNKNFSSPERVANLVAAWKNVRALDDEHNIKEWTAAKEKALSELSGVQRDTAKKVLDNMDIQLDQENKQREEGIKLTQEKQKTEKSSQEANRASADLSRASAATERTQKQIYDEEREIKKLERKFRESTQTQEIEAKLAELRANKIISDKDYEEGKKKLDSIQKFNLARENSKAVEAGYLFFDWLSDILSGPLKGVLK